MSNENKENKLWGGRFSEPTDAFVERFTASEAFDRRMAAQDIRGSLAHARMLQAQGVIGSEDLAAIEQGLAAVAEDIESGQFQWSVSLEDVHMNIEAALTAKIGDAGKRLHTGRSRNDQVATDIRLWLRDAIDAIAAEMTRLQQGIVTLADQHAGLIMPGFTHLQAAQPVTFGHHLLAWNEMVERDYSRLMDCRARMNRCPLGSAALAGNLATLSRIVLPLWHDRQSDCRLVGSKKVARSVQGTMWSTSVAAVITPRPSHALHSGAPSSCWRRRACQAAHLYQRRPGLGLRRSSRRFMARDLAAGA